RLQDGRLARAAHAGNQDQFRRALAAILLAACRLRFASGRETPWLHKLDTSIEAAGLSSGRVLSVILARFGPEDGLFRLLMRRSLRFAGEPRSLSRGVVCSTSALCLERPDG